MEDLELITDLHRDTQRQGPGSDDETRLAVTLSGLRGARGLKVADIGCGSGASTLVLAKELDAAITAVDFLPQLLANLDKAAERQGVEDRITTLAASMDALPFEQASLDAIWSEGAIYNLGFENGVQTWRPFLKPGGILAASELTWLTHERPDEIDRYWMAEYPQIATASANTAILEANGFSPIGYFTLSDSAWLDNYYRPVQARFESFLARHGSSEAARALIAAESNEIAMYERFSTYFSYGYYIARKTGD